MVTALRRISTCTHAEWTRQGLGLARTPNYFLMAYVEAGLNQRRLRIRRSSTGAIWESPILVPPQQNLWATIGPAGTAPTEESAAEGRLRSATENPVAVAAAVGLVGPGPQTNLWAGGGRRLHAVHRPSIGEWAWIHKPIVGRAGRAGLHLRSLRSLRVTSSPRSPSRVAHRFC